MANEEVKIGVAGLNTHLTLEGIQGVLEVLPDPDEILAKKGIGREELRKLMFDTEISSASNRRKNAIFTMPYRIEGDDQKNVDFANWIVKRYGYKTLTAAHKSVWYGFNVLELVWGVDKVVSEHGEHWLPNQLIDMPVKSFAFLKSGECIFKPEDGDPVIIQDGPKFLITVREPSYENPYGEALLSRLFWSWFFRYNGLKFWSIGSEKATLPMLLLETNEKDEAVLTELAKKLYQAVLDGVLAIPKGRDVKVINREGDLKALELFMQYHDKQIRRVILGQSGTSDISGTGSYAAMNKLQEVTIDERDADARIVGPTVQKLIDAVFAVNFGPTVTVPVFIMEDENEIQAERADQDSKIATILHNQGGKFSKSYFTEKYNYDEEHILMDDAAEVTNEKVDPAKTQQSALANKYYQFSTKGLTDDQKTVESFIEDTLKMAKSPIDPELIGVVIQNSKDVDDLAVKLSKLLSGDSKEYEDLLAQSKFSMDAFGFQQAQEEMDES